MCSCISVGPSSAVTTGPSAVSTVVPVSRSSVAIRRTVVKGRDQPALDRIDSEPEPFEGVGAQHVKISRAAEEADGVEGSSLEGDDHLRGVALDHLALDGHDAAALGWCHRQ